MIVADLARALLVATIPTLARLDILWVYVITFLLTTTTLFFRPAKDGLIPNIVPEQGLLAANSLSSAADTTMDVLGYPLAGALVGGVAGLLAGARGIDLAFYIDAGTYLFSALMIYQMTIPRTVHAQEKLQIGNLVRMVGDGLRFVRSQAVLLTNTLVIVFGALVASGANTLAFGYAMDVTESGPFGYSLLEAAIGLGNVVGALAVGRWGGRVRKGPLILIGLVIMGAGYGALALIAELWVAVGILVVSGVANMLFLIPSITLVQQLTPDAFRGRVLGFRGTLITTALITSNALMGLLGERYGVQPMFGVAGGLLVLVGLLAFLVPSARDAN
jgi:predicted MFS family arabinose efflux permease